MIKKYKDFVAKGNYNKVLHLDDEWLIKTPLKKDELDPTIDNHEDISAQEIITRFKEHINYMKSNPKFFPEIRKLDKYRVAVKKLDTQKAIKELKYFFSKIPKFLLHRDYSIYNILDILYRARIDSRDILDYMKEYELKDPIIKKWYDFIMALKYELEPPTYKDLDLHDENIGLEKDGTIKLLDF